jgi:WD40 repeat protein
MNTTPNLFRIFISSTFDDLVAERNALHNEVFPRLQDFCRQRGARFQVVDLRWGVSEEAGRDQQTMNICVEELRRCQAATPRPNYVVLLGERYGWRPLPSQISACEFEQLIDALPMDPRKRLLRWYRRDDNAVPPEYCLQPRAHDFESHEAWVQEEALLRSYLLAGINTVLPTDDPRRTKYEASATHQEILEGALGTIHPEHKVFVYLRTIYGLPQDSRAGTFIDLDANGSPDADATRRLEKVRTDLRCSLPEQQVHAYSARYTDKGLTNEHLAALCARVYHDLQTTIEEELRALEARPAITRELDAHFAVAKEHGSKLVGRDELLNHIATYIKSTEPHPLVIHGLSGTGKTALMSRAILDRVAAGNDERIVLYRFIGATPASTDLQSLLDGLCRQLAERYAADRPSRRESPDFAGELSGLLRKATAERPLVIFLDAIDQLSVTRSDRPLHWLPCALPPHVRLVVAMRESDDAAGECGRVIRTLLPEQCHVTVGPLSAEAGAELLERWLAHSKRTVTPRQRHEILSRFADCPRPLYLKLACEEARRWKSYDDDGLRSHAASRLSAGIPGILNDMLARLEQQGQHGETLVRKTLGYLAAARNGLAEDELLDVLSADTELMADFVARSPVERKKRMHGESALERLPIVVWLRLYYDVSPYLIERHLDHSILLAFYHQDVAEAVKVRYFTGEEKRESHRRLATYFGRQQSWVGAQYSTGVPNSRKASELVHHLIRGRMWDVVQDILAGENALPLLEAKVAAGQAFDLAAHFADVLQTATPDEVRHTVFTQLEAALRRDIGFIDKHSIDYPQALFQCLWNSCWWHDCPELDAHCEARSAAVPQDGATWQSDGRRIHELLERWRTVKEVASPGFPWIRSLHPAGRIRLIEHVRSRNGISTVCSSSAANLLAVDNGEGAVLIHNLENDKLFSLDGQGDEICSIAFSPDGSSVAGGSADGAVWIWDLHTKMGQRLERHEDAVKSLSFSPNGQWLVSGSVDNTVCLWDTNKRVLKYSLGFSDAELAELGLTGTDFRKGHEDTVQRVMFFPDGRRFASCSDDGTIRIWDTDQGTEIAVLRGHGEPFRSLAFNPAGTSFASASADGTIRFWDATTYATLRTWECPQLPGHYPTCLAFSPNGRWLITGNGYGHVSVLNAADGSVTECLSNDGDYVTEVAISRDGRVIASAHRGHHLCLWSFDYLRDSNCEPTAHSGDISDIRLSPDARFFATAACDATVRWWEMERGQQMASWTAYDDWVTSVAVSPTAAYRGIAVGTAAGSVTLWNADSGDEARLLQTHEGRVSNIAVSPDGRLIATNGEDAVIRVWDEQQGKTAWELPHPAYDSALKGDQSLSERHVSAILDDMERHATDVVFSPNGRWLAASYPEGDICLWDLGNAMERRVLRGSGEFIDCLAFSPNGWQLMSGARDSLRLWDVASGSALGELPGHSAGIWGLAFSADGTYAASGGFDFTLRRWCIQTMACVELITNSMSGDLAAIAEGASRCPLRVRTDSLSNELVVEQAATAKQIALYPEAISQIRTHFSGRTWAGRLRNEVRILRLEN